MIYSVLYVLILGWRPDQKLTLIRSVLYRLVHFILELFFNTDALSKKKLK